MSTQSNDLRIVAVFSLCLAVVVPAACFTINASLPYNALGAPLVGRSAARTLAPEGWKFFTREPEEPRLLPWMRSPLGVWSPAHLGANAEPRNLFGLGRMSRAQAVEMGQLVSDVENAVWHDCNLPIDACLEEAPIVATIANRHTLHSLCGDVGLVLQRPVPWAWARRRVYVEMPTKLMRIRVAC